jgi:hypothetical protein
MSRAIDYFSHEPSILDKVRGSLARNLIPTFRSGYGSRATETFRHGSATLGLVMALCSLPWRIKAPDNAGGSNTRVIN